MGSTGFNSRTAPHHEVFESLHDPSVEADDGGVAIDELAVFLEQQAAAVARVVTPGCQIGYTRILAVINWCFDCKITW
jgi:hypothetical protein